MFDSPICGVAVSPSGLSWPRRWLLFPAASSQHIFHPHQTNPGAGHAALAAAANRSAAGHCSLHTGTHPQTNPAINAEVSRRRHSREAAPLFNLHLHELRSVRAGGSRAGWGAELPPNTPWGWDTWTWNSTGHLSFVTQGHRRMFWKYRGGKRDIQDNFDMWGLKLQRILIS